MPPTESRWKRRVMRRSATPIVASAAGTKLPTCAAYHVPPRSQLKLSMAMSMQRHEDWQPAWKRGPASLGKQWQRYQHDMQHALLTQERDDGHLLEVHRLARRVGPIHHHYTAVALAHVRIIRHEGLLRKLAEHVPPVPHMQNRLGHDLGSHKAELKRRQGCRSAR